jgi:hypothetical protein
MPFIDETLADQLGGSTARVSVAFLMKTDDGGDPPGWVRFWGGHGPFEIAANGIDTQGGVYAGAGQLLNVPALSQLINGVAERVDFSLSGVSPEVFALADEEAELVRDAPVHLALLPLDADFALIGTPLWIWEGQGDVLRVDREVSGASVTRTITLSVGTLFTGRRRRQIRHYSGVDQRRRSADDAFCDRTNLYNVGTTDRWP